MAKLDQENSFFHLDPNLVLQATENAGFHPTGEFSQLNSYENRVFDIQIDNNARVIAKFYRPQRWSISQIEEEHEFLFDLQQHGLTVAAPLLLSGAGKKSVIMEGSMAVSFFPKVQGRLLHEFTLQDLKSIGRKLALLHNVGAQKKFRHRASIGEFPFNPEENLELLKEWIWPDLRSRYVAAAETILEALVDTIEPKKFIRIHGDAHRGNILHNGRTGPESEYFFVDFDDSMSGPEVQDFWMLFSSIDNHEEEAALIEGYEELRQFPQAQLKWIPLMRSLRIINYAAWIARRWNDPAFPRIFSEFNTFKYWAEEVEALEKIAWSF